MKVKINRPIIIRPKFLKLKNHYFLIKIMVPLILYPQTLIFNKNEAVIHIRFIETSCKGIGISEKKKADTIFSVLRRVCYYSVVESRGIVSFLIPNYAYPLTRDSSVTQK